MKRDKYIRSKPLLNGKFSFLLSLLLVALVEGCIDSHSLSKDPQIAFDEINDTRERILKLEIINLEMNLSLLSSNSCEKGRLEKAWQALEDAKDSLEMKDYHSTLHYWSESDFYYEYCKLSKQENFDLNLNQLENSIRQAIEENDDTSHNSIYGIEWISYAWNALVLSNKRLDTAKIYLENNERENFLENFSISISNLNYALVSFKIARNRDPQGVMINKEFFLNSLKEKVVELENEFNQIIQEFQQIEQEDAEYALREANAWYSKSNEIANLYDKIWYLLIAIYELESYLLYIDASITTEMMESDLESLLEDVDELVKEGESLESDMLIPHIFLDRALEYQKEAEVYEEKKRNYLSRAIVLVNKTCDFSEYWIELLKLEQKERIFYIQESRMELNIKSLTYADDSLSTKIYSLRKDDLDWFIEFDEKSKECSVFLNGEEITPPLLSKKKTDITRVQLKEGINILQQESLIKIDNSIMFRPLPLGIKNSLGKHAYPFDEYKLQTSLQFPYIEEAKVTVQIPQGYSLATESGLYLDESYDPRHLKLANFEILDLDNNIYIIRGNLNVFEQTEIVVIFKSGGTNSKLALFVIAVLFFFLGFQGFDTVYFAKSLRRRKLIFAIISISAYYLVIFTLSSANYFNLFHICPLFSSLVGFVISKIYLKKKRHFRSRKYS